MTLIAEVFSQGEELVTGQIVDSNAAWLSTELTDLGFKVQRHTAVGDDLEGLTQLFKEIASRADLCVCTGGLGPTVDDLTSAAVSLAANLPLQFDEQALLQIQEFFTRRGRDMPAINRKQAYFPQTAQRIDNTHGTAPGFSLKFMRCWFVFLPGVPAEMKPMFSSEVKPHLLQRFALQPDHLVSLRSIGIGESAIQQILQAYHLPATVKLGFRASLGEVQTKLLFPAGFPESEKATYITQIADLLGDYVYTIDSLSSPSTDLVVVIDELMLAGNLSLAVLETASSGLIAAKCQLKSWLQGVEVHPHQWTLLDKCPETEVEFVKLAGELALALQVRRETQLALVQIYAGDAAAFADKDRSIVIYNAICASRGLVNSRHLLSGSLVFKQNQAALLALDLLRRFLQNKCH